MGLGEISPWLMPSIGTVISSTWDVQMAYSPRTSFPGPPSVDSTSRPTGSTWGQAWLILHDGEWRIIARISMWPMPGRGNPIANGPSSTRYWISRLEISGAIGSIVCPRGWSRKAG